MYITNASVLTFALITILMYFKTGLFDGIKKEEMMESCVNIEKNVEASYFCTKACLDRLCCFDSSCTTYGTSEQSAEDCGVYSDCEPLYKLKKELETDCSQEVMIRNKMECGRKCRLSECCWQKEQADNCSVKKPKMCDFYLPCAIYYTDPSDFGMGVGPVLITP